MIDRQRLAVAVDDELMGGHIMELPMFQLGDQMQMVTVVLSAARPLSYVFGVQNALFKRLRYFPDTVHHYLEIVLRRQALFCSLGSEAICLCCTGAAAQSAEDKRQRSGAGRRHPLRANGVHRHHHLLATYLAVLCSGLASAARPAI